MLRPKALPIIDEDDEESSDAPSTPTTANAAVQEESSDWSSVSSSEDSLKDDELLNDILGRHGANSGPRREPKTVSFEQGVHGRGRSRKHFNRKSAWYIRGRWACPTRGGWLNTSGYTVEDWGEDSD